MKYKQILLGKPKSNSWSFVRGTSVQKAVQFLVDGEYAAKHPGIFDPVFFHVHGHIDFPKTYEFSEKFAAPNKDYVFLPAEAYAKQHAFHDYLAEKFSELYYLNSFSETPYFYKHIDFEKYKYKPENFYKDYSPELIKEGFRVNEVKKQFEIASYHQGVLIYFNNSLMENLLIKDKRERLNRQFNSVSVNAETSIKLDCIEAIQPLSWIDKYELKLFATYLKDNKESY